MTRATTLPDSFAAPSFAVGRAPLGAELPRRDRIEAVAVDDDAVDRARGCDRDRALLDHVLAHLQGIALERIAEPARRRPDHGVDVLGLLDEILLAQLQRDVLAFHLGDVGRDLALLQALRRCRSPRLNL